MSAHVQTRYFLEKVLRDSRIARGCPLPVRTLTVPGNQVGISTQEAIHLALPYLSAFSGGSSAVANSLIIGNLSGCP